MANERHGLVDERLIDVDHRPPRLLKERDDFSPATNLPPPKAPHTFSLPSPRSRIRGPTIRASTAPCECREREHEAVTGEEVLRRLAEELARDASRAQPEHREGVILRARPFLTGAFIALARAKAFAERPSLEVLEELLAPIEQPLVDQGVIERFSSGFDASATTAVVPEEGTELQRHIPEVPGPA